MVQLAVADWLVPCLLGTKGAALRELMAYSGATIKVWNLRLVFVFILCLSYLIRFLRCELTNTRIFHILMENLVSEHTFQSAYLFLAFFGGVITSIR
jgi:hypothetical protein